MKCMAIALGLVSIASLAAAQAPAAGAQAAPAPAMTNLQIIPKDTPRPQVLATMQAFTQSLGVQCNYCHVFEGRGGRNDMASDEKPAKKAARGMMLLAREINTKLPDAVGKAADATTRVGCATCHRGVPIPKQIADIVTDAAGTGGATAGLAKFKELRTQFYGGQSYDFSEGSQHRKQGRRCAGLPEREPRVLPEVGADLRDHRRGKEREGRQARRDRGAGESGRARSQQRAGQGAVGRFEEVASRQLFTRRRAVWSHHDGSHDRRSQKR